MIVIQALYDTEELHWPHAVAVAVRDPRTDTAIGTCFV